MIRARTRCRGWTGVVAGGGASGTAPAPSSVTAGYAPFVSGTTDAAQVYAELYSVTDGAVVGSRVAATMGGGYWSTGNLPATSSTAKTYNHRIYSASSGGSPIVTSSNWTTAVWATKPQTTRLQAVTATTTPTVSADNTALLAMHSPAAVPRLASIVAASSLSALTITACTSDGSNLLTFTTSSTVPAVGDYIKLTGTLATVGSTSSFVSVVTSVTGSQFTCRVQTSITVGAVSPIPTASKVAAAAQSQFILKFNAVASPGGCIWYDLLGSLAFSVLFETSTDGISYTPSTHTPWRPPTYNTTVPSPVGAAAGRGQMFAIGTTASPVWVRATFFNWDTQNAIALNVAALQYRAAGDDDIMLELGMSITYQDDAPLIMRKRIKNIDSTRDPFIINLGHPGGKLSDMLSNHADWLTTNPNAIYGYALLDAGPNDAGSSNTRLYTNTGNPPTAANGTNAAIGTINTNFPACVTSLMSRNGALSAGSYKRVFAANIGHTDYAAASPAAAVSDLTNTSQGAEPYNYFVVDPLLRTGTNLLATWYPKLGLAQVDCQTAFQLDAPNWFFTDLTTHPGAAGQIRHHQMSDPVQYYLSFGNAGQTEYERQVAAIATVGAPSFYKTRLTTIAGLLSPTSNLPAAEKAVADNERAVIAASLLAAPTVFTQKTGTPPTSLGTQPLAWWQFHDWSTLTFDSSGRISQINDKGPNGYNLSQATTASMSPYIPGAWPGGRSVARTNGNASKLGGSGAPAGLKSAMDAANQPFMFFSKTASYSVGNGGGLLGWGAAGAQTLQIQQSGNDDLGLSANAPWRIIIAGALRLAEPATTFLQPYVPVVMSHLYDGTTLYIRRNGVQTASGAYAKPSHVGDTFSLLANGPGTSLFAGEVGEVILRSDYNLSDAAAIETWLAVT